MHKGTSDTHTAVFITRHMPLSWALRNERSMHTIRIQAQPLLPSPLGPSSTASPDNDKRLSQILRPGLSISNNKAMESLAGPACQIPYLKLGGTRQKKLEPAAPRPRTHNAPGRF